MSKRHQPSFEARARILKAMAHPGRLRVLFALEAGEQTVTALREVLGTDLSTASRHLSAMRSAGLLAVRREGSTALYRLRVPCVLKFFGCVEAVLAEDLVQARQVVRLRTAGRGGAR